MIDIPLTAAQNGNASTRAVDVTIRTKNLTNYVKILQINCILRHKALTFERRDFLLSSS